MAGVAVMSEVPRGSPALTGEEWELLLEFYLTHGPGPYRADDLAWLSEQVRAVAPPDTSPQWRRPDGLRRRLAVFRALERQDLSAGQVPRLARLAWEHRDQPSVLARPADAMPSRGPRPTFGLREAALVDGEHHLYVLRLDGPVAALLPAELAGRAVVKVGFTSDLRRRQAEVGSGIPPRLGLAWHIVTSRALPNASLAYDAEQLLISALTRDAVSLGREFFAIEPDRVDTLLETVDRAIRQAERPSP
jgi:hypothetical protein